MGGLHFSYEAWDQGLAIMFVDRVHGDIKGTGNLVDGVDTQGMSVIRSDGIGYEWVLRTTDGVTADLTINGASYDMARGALFAIQLDGDQVVVHQVDRELPGFDHGGQGMRECTAFVNSSPDLIRLVTGEREEDL